MPRTNAVRDWDGWRAPPPGRCAQCGVDASLPAAGELGPTILALLPRWASVLMRPGVGRAVEPLAWSVLDHAVHVRDLITAVAARLGRLLHEGHTSLESLPKGDGATRGAGSTRGADRTVAGAMLGAPDPLRVAVDIDDAGRTVATRLDALTPAAALGGEGGGKETSDEHAVSATALARHLIHDVIHHLHAVNAWRPPDGQRVD